MCIASPNGSGQSFRAAQGEGDAAATCPFHVCYAQCRICCVLCPLPLSSFRIAGARQSGRALFSSDLGACSSTLRSVPSRLFRKEVTVRQPSVSLTLGLPHGIVCYEGASTSRRSWTSPCAARLPRTRCCHSTNVRYPVRRTHL